MIFMQYLPHLDTPMIITCGSLCNLILVPFFDKLFFADTGLRKVYFIRKIIE